MTTKILLKKSSTGSSVPVPADLEYGELALNYADGVLFYKDSTGEIRSISGSSGGGASLLNRTEFIATDGQTLFNVSYTVGSNGYPMGFVYLNGVLLLAGDDYTGSNGVFIELTQGADLGDVIEVFTFSVTSIADTLQITNNLSDVNDAAASLSNLNANLGSFVSTFTLPTTDGTVGQALLTDGSGTISFGTVASSGSELPADSLGYLYNDGTGSLSWGTFTIPADVSDLTDTTNLLFDGQYNSLTGTPTIPVDVSELTDTTGLFNPAYGDSDVGTYLTSNGYDTTANIVASITDSAPLALDTLNELAAALGDDANFATTVTNNLALKANSADLSLVATSGSYTDLINSPTIPSDVSDLSDTGNLLTHFDPSSITESLIPQTDISIDLGSLTHRWRDLHLSGSTIFLGDSSISDDAGAVVLPENSKVAGKIIPTEIIRYESKTISNDTTLDNFTHYYAGINTVINNGVTLTIPADTLLEVRAFAASKPL